MYSLKSCLWIILGTLAVALGVVGIFLPLVPTTPFLLLAAFCYLRSSARLYNWLLNHKIFGAYIYNYLTYKAIPMKTKIGTIVFLWGTLIVSMVLIASLHVRLFLLLVGIGVSGHVMFLKTLRPGDTRKS